MFTSEWKIKEKLKKSRPAVDPIDVGSEITRIWQVLFGSRIGLERMHASNRIPSQEKEKKQDDDETGKLSSPIASAKRYGANKKE